ncbi:MAG: hypothetical protein AAGE18_07065 [Pseudomonadota bacterium]
MAARVLILLGTNKGVFFLESDAARAEWSLRGPFCDTWPINHVLGDPETGTIWAGGGNGWVGTDVWKTTDLGASWSKSGAGLAFEAPGEEVACVWSFAKQNGTLYAAVNPAALFQSEDGGETWQHLEGLQQHPSRPDWHGGGAGRCGCFTQRGRYTY